MLSILIPTYDYYIFPLAKELHGQGTKAKINFELICIDDGSNSKINKENNKINELENCSFIANKVNLGRSGIRNLLAKKAKYDFLLFLDSDVEIIHESFLNNYLTLLTDNISIICGGILYQKEVPNNNQLLRWVYGKKREALNVEARQRKPHLAFLTLNFIIKKSILSKVKFNEDMPNLRNEDLVFAMDVKNEKIDIQHINNPVIHLGIETSEMYIIKTKETLQSFKTIVRMGVLDPNDASITRLATRLQKLKLSFIFKFLWKVFNKYFEKNLLSNNPSLYIFDLYRLCYYLQLKN